MAAIAYERIVEEDLNRGSDTVDVTMPAGGTATGTQVGIHSFLDRWRNVIDYGAAVNGTTPDQDAIQAAIDSLTTGGIVVLPAGHYALSGTITFGSLTGITILLDAGVTFSGVGSLPTSTGANRIVDLGAMNTDRVRENTVLGYAAGEHLTTGGTNLLLGPYAGRALTVQTGNTFVGDRAGLNNVASDNVFVGSTTGQSNTTGTRNTFVGRCGNQNTTGVNNTFVGYTAGNLNTIGADNTYIGVGAGVSTIDGFGNTMIGSNAGIGTISGNGNTFVGNACGQGNVHSNFNTYVGKFCGQIETGQANAYFGYKCGFESTAGNRNTYLGNSAAEHWTTATDSVVVGYDAGHGLAVTGGGNVLVGPTTKVVSVTSSSATAIGNDAQAETLGVALGVGANAFYRNSVAVGAFATTGRLNAVVLGSSTESDLRVGIGTNAPDDLALLDLSSNSTAPKCLLLPRLSDAQMNALSPGSGYGYLIYNINLQAPCWYNGSVWKTMASL